MLLIRIHYAFTGKTDFPLERPVAAGPGTCRMRSEGSMRNETAMKRTTILALAMELDCPLLLPVRSIVENESAIGLSLVEEVLPENPSAASVTKIVGKVRAQQPDLVAVCLNGKYSGRFKGVLSALTADGEGLPVLAIVDGGHQEDVCELLRLGVTDFVASPLRPVDLLPRLWKLSAERVMRAQENRELDVRLSRTEFVGSSAIFLEAIQKLPALATCTANILITGETGTGKELCARAIHYLGARADKPFVPLNCGAIPVELVENELFGHDKGAYTGAISAAPGLMRSAANGTVFLDEIDSLPLAAQVKLLRFLQTKEFQPLGSAKTCTIDVRVIAATNSDLEEAVRSGRFRSDLYYRLNVVPIKLPPLRERLGDILLLAQHFLRKYSSEFGKAERVFSRRAAQKLLSYDWPGNIRELQNIVERAVVLSECRSISCEDILLPAPAWTKTCESFRASKARIVGEFERSYIQQVLFAHDGNISRAAQAASKDRRAFWQLMRKHRLVIQFGGPQNSLKSSTYPG